MERVDVGCQRKRYDIGFQAVLYGQRLFARTAVREADICFLPMCFLPVVLEKRVVFAVELACRVVRYIQHDDALGFAFARRAAGLPA